VPGGILLIGFSFMDGCVPREQAKPLSIPQYGKKRCFCAHAADNETQHENRKIIFRG